MNIFQFNDSYILLMHLLLYPTSLYIIKAPSPLYKEGQQLACLFMKKKFINILEIVQYDTLQ